MRDLPGYPTSVDVVEPIVRVVHRGRDREVDSLSLSRELPSSFHEQVRGLGGITQATGSVDWAPLADVVESQPTAFNRIGGWPPKTRDAVDVFTGIRTATGDLLAKQLTGFVSKSSGDPLEGVASGLVDGIARLSRKVSLPSLQAVMPPLADGAPHRGVGLHPTFFTDRAARAGRFYSTPQVSTGCVLSAPLMGSAWPEVGNLTSANRASNPVLPSATWSEVPWGMGVSDAELTYQPVGSTALNRAMEITAMFDVAAGAGTATVAIVWGDVLIRLLRNSATAWAQLITPSGATTVASLSAPRSDVISLRVGAGGTLMMTVRDGSGREASGTIARPVETLGTATAIRVTSPDTSSKIGGVQVAFPSLAWAAVSYTRSAFITPSAHRSSLLASPPIIDVSARSILEDQAQAELAALWIDGDGYFHWVNRDRLVSGPSVATLTSRDHLKSLPWEEDFTGVASRVEVVGRRAEAINRSRYYSHEVWRSNYSKIEADGTDDVLEELLHPDADLDWIMVDTSFNNDYADANNMRGSDVGLYYFFESGTAGQAGYTAAEGYTRGSVTAQLELVDHRTYKLITKVYAASKFGYEKAEFSLKIPTEHQSPLAGGWGANLGGMSFPVIRAKGTTGWADVTYAADAQVWDAPVLTHDVGWWQQDPAECQAIADLLASRVTDPQPSLAGVSVVPDSRLQLGDVVTLEDSDLTGVRYRCVTVGIEDSFTSSPTRWEQSCKFLVLSTTSM